MEVAVGAVVDKLVTLLGMSSPERLRPARDVPGLEVVRVADPPGEAERIRWLHHAIATPHEWSSLYLDWDLATIRAVLAAPDRSDWLAAVAGSDVGWASLTVDGDEVEIAAFGVVPDALGRGYGGAFLTEVVRAAWRPGSDAAERRRRRVWLHTSSWDHPNALRNYLARGFEVERLERWRYRAGDTEATRTPVDRAPRFLVRPAVPDDDAAVSGLLGDLGYDVPTRVVRERLRRRSSSRDDVVAVVVERRADVVGVVSAHLVPMFAEDEPAFARITALAVAPDRRRHGLGRMLVDFVDHVASRQGVRLLEVSSGRREERAAAHRFYPALGFVDAAPVATRYWKRREEGDA